VNRIARDQVRCADKYGKYWEQYEKKVPYSLIPGIY
jgi:delta14-sterol reductase